ncbi:MAG TPA: sugar-binding domain-containing protein [Spirochaetia bacterium]|nr:sugar-binding domain-containing protein [Spirochaetia bacterium]
MSAYSQEMLVAVSHLYYMEGLKQEDVAFRMNLSRLAVTRMLKKAREEGVVQITVKGPLPELVGLALRLEQAFGLKAVRVVQTAATADDTAAAMGRAGAELLSHLLRPNVRLGVAWSRTVSSILPYVRRATRAGVIVNELAGTYLAPNIPYSVSWQLAEKLGVPLESVPMPVLVKSEHVRQIMLKEPMIRRAMANAARVDLALVGLGNVLEGSSLEQSGYITPSHLQEFKSKGAVGDILMRYYDRDGRYIHMSFEKRTVSVSWDQLRKLPFIVAMAFGPAKIEAINGALAGGFIHGLVTDASTARTLLEGIESRIDTENEESLLKRSK